MQEGQSSSRRVLMIAPYFPPRARVGAERPFKLARYLPSCGWEPLVAHLESAGEARPGLAEMARLSLRAPFDRTAARPAPAAAKPGKPATKPWLTSAIDRRFPVDTWWPVLVGQTRRVARAARAFGVSAVWSTADPWSSHALALRVARALGLPWVADFRDPWTLCAVRGHERPGWVRAWDARCERSYLEHASAVTFTAAQTTARYAEAYPELSGRFHTIENGFDPAMLTDQAPVVPLSSVPGVLTICFFGRFRPLSSATRVIETLARVAELQPTAVSQLRIRMAGPLEAADEARARRAGVFEVFEPFQPVAAHAAGPLLEAHDVLWLSTEPGRDEIIPAKLFDYLAARKPILSLCQNADVATILQETGTGTQVTTAHDAARCLLAALRAKREGVPMPFGAVVDPEQVARYGAPQRAAQLAALLDNVAPQA